MELVPWGYEPPMSADMALELFEEQLAAIEQRVRLTAAHAWDQLPKDDVQAQQNWLAEFYRSVDEQWGFTAAVCAGDYVRLNRVANGYEPGEPVYSSAVSTRTANARASDLLVKMDTKGDSVAASFFEDQIAKLVLNRARHTVHNSAASVGSSWCRVPERGACWFCLMLAGRGGVYRSKNSAARTRSGSHYHNHCRCIPSEVFPEGPLPTRTQACMDYQEKHGITRGAVVSGHFTASTGIASVSVTQVDDHRLGRSKRPSGFKPRLDPLVEKDTPFFLMEEDAEVITHGVRRNGRVKGGHMYGYGGPGKTVFPKAWTEDDIVQAIQLAFLDPDFTQLRGDARIFRRDVHGVIVEARWYPGPDGTPVISHCYPLSGDGVCDVLKDGTIKEKPYFLKDLLE